MDRKGRRVSKPQIQALTPPAPAAPFRVLGTGGSGMYGDLKKYGIEKCPQCKKKFNKSYEGSCRPVQDCCGHFKCRRCFISNEDGCSQCKVPQGPRTRNGGPTTRSQSSYGRNSNGNGVSDNTGGRGKPNNVGKAAGFQGPKNSTTVKHGSGLPGAGRSKLGKKSTTSLITKGLADVSKLPSQNSVSPDSTTHTRNSTSTGNSSMVVARKSRATVQAQPPSPPLLIRALRARNSRSTPAQPSNVVISHDHITMIAGNPTVFQCNVCERKFKTKAHIKYHEYCRNGNKPFKCEQCGQGFIIKSHYEYHLRTHTGERPFACPKCGKRFNQQGKVTRHMKSHTGEKPFVCKECGRRFVNTQALRSHNLIHTRERPFACQYCQKRFTGMTNLKKHTISHTGERPFKCWICGSSFTHKATLDRHIKITHNQPKEVAKQLANEAAAEYLALNKCAPGPMSSLHSAVISNVLRRAANFEMIQKPVDLPSAVEDQVKLKLNRFKL